MAMLETQLEEADEQITKVKAGLDKDRIPAVALSDEEEPEYPPLTSDVMECLDLSNSTSSSESETDPHTLSNSPSGHVVLESSFKELPAIFRPGGDSVGEMV